MGREAREFSTPRHIHCDFFCWWGTSFILRESPHQNNAACAGPRTHGKTSAPIVLLGPSPTTSLSATYTRTPLSETVDGAAKTDGEKWGLWLGWQLCLQDQCGNEGSTIIAYWTHVFQGGYENFLSDFPSLYHSAAPLIVGLFYGSICGGHTMCQAQLMVLKSHQEIK